VTASDGHLLNNASLINSASTHRGATLRRSIRITPALLAAAEIANTSVGAKKSPLALRARSPLPDFRTEC